MASPDPPISPGKPNGEQPFERPDSAVIPPEHSIVATSSSTQVEEPADEQAQAQAQGNPNAMAIGQKEPGASQQHAQQQQPQPPQIQPSRFRAQARTPEPRPAHERINGHHLAEGSPHTPGHLPPFDWEDLETRYRNDLVAANQTEEQLLQEFDQLVQYFNVWATSASDHDSERAVKRLQTRERYVKLSERNLQQKKQHLAEVVRAFQSALALLSQS